MYYPFIQDWINVLGKDQIKVIRYEDYVSNPSEVINDVCSFLQLREYAKMFFVLVLYNLQWSYLLLVTE